MLLYALALTMLVFGLMDTSLTNIKLSYITKGKAQSSCMGLVLTQENVVRIACTNKPRLLEKESLPLLAKTVSLLGTYHSVQLAIVVEAGLFVTVLA
tara:strand:- start:440 stop:730 length:291 start_codon:yes stop_codon:yes gene_type:complete